MNSADAWHEGEDMEAVLGLSVELQETMNSARREIEMEAAKERHPSGKAVTDAPLPPVDAPEVVLNALDRCDQGCGAAALYRVRQAQSELDFCHHHHNKLFPVMDGWVIVGTNPSLMNELYNTNRLKGGDHA